MVGNSDGTFRVAPVHSEGESVLVSPVAAGEASPEGGPAHAPSIRTAPNAKGASRFTLFPFSDDQHTRHPVTFGVPVERAEEHVLAWLVVGQLCFITLELLETPESCLS